MYHITSVAFAKVRSVPYDLLSVDPGKFGFKRIEVSVSFLKKYVFFLVVLWKGHFVYLFVCLLIGHCFMQRVILSLLLISLWYKLFNSYLVLLFTCVYYKSCIDSELE